jgi:ADP-ribose pyrophosphatase
MILISPESAQSTSNKNWSSELVVRPIFEKVLTTAKGYPERLDVPSGLRAWERPLPDYNPPFFESSRLREMDRTLVPGGWADPADVKPNEFQLWKDTGYIKSFEGPIRLDNLTGRPLNPLGRVGISGRGLLGKWGPNHAADAMVTRVSEESGLLEVLLILRKSGDWALPGGMIDTGETALQAAYRELEEETSFKIDQTQPHLFYQGIGDGPRITDNAWVETSAFHFHLQEASATAHQIPIAKSDALDAKWFTISPDLVRSLYANHGELVSMALSQFRARELVLESNVTEQLSDIPHAPLMTNFSSLRGKVAIVGGSFDPVHQSHLSIANHASAKFEFDSIVYIPAGKNPLKSGPTKALPQERVDMLCYALADKPDFFVSPWEARRRDQDSATINTIREIHSQVENVECQLHLILGADCLEDLPKWKDINELISLAKIIPVHRPGKQHLEQNVALLQNLSQYFGSEFVQGLLETYVTWNGKPLSSTDIRSIDSTSTKHIDGLNPAVFSFIQDHSLYRSSP